MAFTPIHTDRLLLRPVRASDADALSARRSDPRVARYQGWRAPYSIENATTSIAEQVTLDGPTAGEWWMLTVADPTDEHVLGDLVVHLTEDGHAAEIGYTFEHSAWGHGYAVEAAVALVDCLFRVHEVTRIEGRLHPDNHASAMVLERIGMLFEGHLRLSYWLDGENSDDLVYAMTRADWQAWRGRARHRPDIVELVDIERDDLDDVLTLSTHRSQERFVWPVARSLADALVPPTVHGERVVPWYRAVRADDDIVGFVMVALSPTLTRSPLLWRLFVDRMHQRRSIGGAVIDLVVGECRSWGGESLLVSWIPGKGSPEPMYLARGFVATGNIDDGEIEARLTL